MSKHEGLFNTIESIASNKPPFQTGIRPVHSLAYINNLEDQRIRNGNNSDLKLACGEDADSYPKKKLQNLIDLFKARQKFLNRGYFAEWATKSHMNPDENSTWTAFCKAGVDAQRLLLEAAPDFGGMQRALSTHNDWFQNLWDMNAEDLLPFLQNPSNAKVLKKFQQLGHPKIPPKPFFAQVQHQLPIAIKIADVYDEDALVTRDNLMAMPVAMDPTIIQKWKRVAAAKSLKNRKENLWPFLVKVSRVKDQEDRALKRPSNNALVGSLDEDCDEPMEDPVNDAPVHVPKRARNTEFQRIMNNLGN